MALEPVVLSQEMIGSSITQEWTWGSPQELQLSSPWRKWISGLQECPNSISTIPCQWPGGPGSPAPDISYFVCLFLVWVCDVSASGSAHLSSLASQASCLLLEQRSGTCLCPPISATSSASQCVEAKHLSSLLQGGEMADTDDLSHG